ncbi:MAG: hypothetical protein WA637_10520 [Terriglobales bacterium]
MHNPNCLHNFRFVIALVTATMLPLIPKEAYSTDQFSRQYNTSCTSCHTAFPKLNDIGLAFKDAGFQFSEEDTSFIATPQTLLSLPDTSVPTSRMAFRSPAYATLLSSITNLEMRALQQKYFHELTCAGTQISSLRFPHHFYLSLALDVNERTEKRSDQRSLRFAKFDGDTVLEVTGNYYAAYPRDQIVPDQRVRQTLEDILLPMLKVLLVQFEANPDVHGYVLEVSHHVRGKVLGVSWETAENVALALPQHSAVKLVAAQNSSERQALLGEVQVFLNSKAITLPPTGDLR